MAPIRPRPPSSPSPSLSFTTSLTNPFKTPHKRNKAPTKRQKARDRHSALLSHLKRTAPGSKIQKTKRRRPKNKLAELKGLEAVLPSFEEEASVNKEVEGGDDEGGVKDGKTARDSTGQSKASKHEREEHWKERPGMKIGKSMKSRPGAGKRREKVVAMERERFAKNLAVMTAVGRDGESNEEGEGREAEQEKARRERWAAIRRFIGGRVGEHE